MGGEIFLDVLGPASTFGSTPDGSETGRTSSISSSLDEPRTWSVPPAGEDGEGVASGYELNGSGSGSEAYSNCGDGDLGFATLVLLVGKRGLFMGVREGPAPPIDSAVSRRL